jgi:hypothetical protein
MPAHTGPAMHALIRLFVDIALHRKGPQDVPPAGAVFGLALLSYLVLGAASLWPTAGGLGRVLGQMAVDLGMVVGVFGGLLAVTGRGARLRQTLAALFGTGALITALALPFVWLAAGSVDAESGPGGAALLSAMALFTLLIASLLVTGHILRNALDWSYPAGVLGAVLYFAASVAVFRSLFPVA